jgi:hypothetical protein
MSAQSAAPLTSHLVPVGMEPMIPVLQLGTLRHQYGFSAGTGTKPMSVTPGPSGDQVFTSATALGNLFSSSMIESFIIIYVSAGSSNGNTHVNSQFQASFNNTLMKEAPVSTILCPVAMTTANDGDENDEDKYNSDSSANDMDISKLDLLWVRMFHSHFYPCYSV